MDMEVLTHTQKNISFNISNPRLNVIGNEVADFVKDHLAAELKILPSFKQGNYE